MNGYFAVEGPIGVGKTTLAEQLSKHYSGKLILELAEENPFLNDFYKDRARFAFQTQIYFLMSRYKQQEEFIHRDLFSETVVADYIFAKDRIFANINLSDKELGLYDRVAGALEKNIVKPDLVIYLTASIESLVARIKKRNRHFEKSLDKEYLEIVCDAYSDYFFHYNKTPMLIIKTDQCDFTRDRDKFDYLVEKINSGLRQTEYITFES